MAIKLPLPYQVADEATQANFDALAQNFPLSKKHMKLETPHLVGAAGEPAFQNSWVNYDGGWQVARFWKDSMDIVRVQGLVKNGTIGAGLAVFTLPVGYRPGATLLWATDSNAAHGRLEVYSDGKVVANAGNNAWFSLTPISFKQEA